jgi:outer membrane protein assembly factor BamA
MSWLSPIGPLKVSMGFPLKKDETTRFNASSSRSVPRSDPHKGFV